jgi:hypothetical protein
MIADAERHRTDDARLRQEVDTLAMSSTRSPTRSSAGSANSAIRYPPTKKHGQKCSSPTPGRP